MKKNYFLLIGVLVYVLSFFLVAAHSDLSESPVWGWACAVGGLLSPLMVIVSPGSDKFLGGVIGSIAYLMGGLINPVFWWYLNKPSTILRYAVLLMIPFSWIFFYRDHLFPREGHYVWIAGMLVVLFSDKLDRLRHVSNATDAPPTVP